MLESRAALYPRIILDESIIDVGSKHRSINSITEEREYIVSLLELDSDGMYYIDYFSKAIEELDDPDYDFPKYIDNLSNVIRKGLMASSHHSKADLRIKFSWMRERYNRMVRSAKDAKFIAALKDEGDIEIAEFYEKLKEISPNKFLKTASSPSNTK